jgi:hypothetical protein
LPTFTYASAEPWHQSLWHTFLVSLSTVDVRAVFEQLGAWTPTAWVAVIGIVIEGVFVAMIIQRLFR